MFRQHCEHHNLLINLAINATAQYMNTAKKTDVLLKIVSDRTEMKKGCVPVRHSFLFYSFQTHSHCPQVILYNYASRDPSMCICLLQIETMESQVHARSERQNKPSSKFTNYIVKGSMSIITFHS